jgi:hypothetical protein
VADASAPTSTQVTSVAVLIDSSRKGTK